MTGAAPQHAARESGARRLTQPGLRSSPTPGLSMDPADWTLQVGLGLAQLLGRYHRHRIRHFGRLEKLFEHGRRVILVGNHALDIVDPALLLADVYRRTGRLARFIGHENGWFKLPLIRDFSRHFQVIPSRRFEEAVEAVRRDGFLMLYPGGVRESGMRSYRDEPYRLHWEGRKGFLRLALEADADLVFVAAIGNDEAFYQSRLPTPRALLSAVNGGDEERYKGMRLRLGAAGVQVFPGVLPLPVRLTHVFSDALDLGARDRARHVDVAFDQLHTRVWGECQEFLTAAVDRREEDTDFLDRSLRAGQAALHWLGL